MELFFRKDEVGEEKEAYMDMICEEYWTSGLETDEYMMLPNSKQEKEVAQTRSSVLCSLLICSAAL